MQSREIKRREFVALAPLALIPGWSQSAAVSSTSKYKEAWLPSRYDTYNSWLVAARAASLEYIKRDGADAEQFIRFLSLWAGAMPEPENITWVNFPGANEPLEFALISAGRPFVVTAFKMAPGCILPAHCHPGGGGITVCTSGHLFIQHFELLPGSAEFTATGARAEVEEVSNACLRKNQFTTFTPTRSNLHQLSTGPEGAVGFDLVVQWEGAGEFSYLRMSDAVTNYVSQPVRALHRRHSGTWAGMELSQAYGRVGL